MSLEAIARRPEEAQTADGWLLRGEAIVPPAPRACVALGHAMMVNRRTLGRLASCLAEHGIAVLCFDLRGHGQSTPSARDGGSWLLDDFVERDLPALVAHARTRFPDLPVTVVGHSLTGLAALLAAGCEPATAPDAIVALAVNMGLPRHEPSVARRVLKSGLFVTWAALARARGRFEPRWLGAGGDPEPWSYVRQYAGICLRDRFVSSDGRDYIEALRGVQLPVLAIASEGDRVLAPPAAVARFMAELEHAEVEMRVVRNGELDGISPNHMTLVTNSACRPVWNEIASWVIERHRR